MAVVDVKTYDNSSTAITKGVAACGSQLIAINATIDVTNGNSATSVFRIAQVPSNSVLIWGGVSTAGIAGCTDCDFGLYNTAEDGGEVVDADALIDGVDLSGAVTVAAPSALGAAIAAADFGKSLNTLESDKSAEFQTYDLAMTLNAAATATGTINVRAILARG
jgi:hypothetical protein